MVDADHSDARELLRRALEIEDRDSDDRWDIVAQLHRRTDRDAFDAARDLTCSPDVAARVLGLDVLGQIGYSANRPFVEETLPIVIGACRDVRSDVVDAAVCAAGHIADSRARDAILSNAEHALDEVRFSVAIALPGVAGDPASADVVQALIALMRDPDSSVRDWATMGLGSQLDVDTPTVRQALIERLDDAEGDTAGEALLGLARRHDARVLAPLLELLERSPGNLIVEAAAELRAPEALPALQRLKQEGWERNELRGSVLDDALVACSRGAKAD